MQEVLALAHKYRQFNGAALVAENGKVTYMAAKERELAIQNYKKSLELNPNNTNAAQMLKRLEN